MGQRVFDPIDRRDLASLLGVSLRHFTDLESKGIVAPLARGRGGGKTLYDVRVALRQYLAYKSKEPARDRLFRLQADRVELENKLRRGELLEATIVDSEWATIATAVKRAVLALPGRLLQRGIITTDKLGPATEEAHDVIRHLGKAGS